MRPSLIFFAQKKNFEKSSLGVKTAETGPTLFTIGVETMR